MLLLSGFQIGTLSFAEVPNQGNIETSEGTSFAAAPDTWLLHCMLSLPVEHTMEEPKCPTIGERRYCGLTQSRLLSRERPSLKSMNMSCVPPIFII